MDIGQLGCAGISREDDPGVKEPKNERRQKVEDKPFQEGREGGILL